MSEKEIGTKQYTVLVAEDDSFLSRVLVDKLEKEHFRVMTAFDGEEAVQKVIEGDIDVIILDIIMPKKNGFDVIDIIKNNPKAKLIPIIVLSNLGQDSDVEMAKAKGVTDYFIKSNISLTSVIDKINEYVNKK